MFQRALSRTQTRLSEILSQTPYSESVIQQLVSKRSAGALAPVLEFYTKGNQIPHQTATTILSKYNARRDAISYKVQHMSFKGSCSNGQVTVECTGLGKIISITMSKQVAALPKQLVNDYILSAFGNAMTMVHTILYEEQVKANNDAFDDVYDALEGYHESEFLNIMSPNSLVPNSKAIQLHVTSNYAAKKLALAESNEDSNQWLDQFMPAGDIPQVPKVGSIEDDYYHFADAWVGKTTGSHNVLAVRFLREFGFHQQYLKLALGDMARAIAKDNAAAPESIADDQVQMLRDWRRETNQLIRNMQQFNAQDMSSNPIEQVVQARQAKMHVKKRLGLYDDNYADKFQNNTKKE